MTSPVSLVTTNVGTLAPGLDCLYSSSMRSSPKVNVGEFEGNTLKIGGDDDPLTA